MNKVITFRLEPALRGLLKQLAEETGRTESEVIRQALHDFLMPLAFQRVRTRQDREAWLARAAQVRRKF